MPRFILKLKVTNNSGVPVSAHVGASLVGTKNSIEYYNQSEDIKKLFPTGETIVQRYLTTDLGAYQKYDLVVALWEGEKTIGHGIKYADFTVKNAVEKKKKITVKMAIAVLDHYPKTYTPDQ